MFLAILFIIIGKRFFQGLFGFGSFQDTQKLPASYRPMV